LHKQSPETIFTPIKGPLIKSFSNKNY